MSLKRFTLRLDEKDIQIIDKLANEQNSSRADIIRNSLHQKAITTDALHQVTTLSVNAFMVSSLHNKQNKLQQSQSSPSHQISSKKLRSILNTYDDYYTSLYFDRLDPQPQNEQQLLQRLDR